MAFVQVYKATGEWEARLIKGLLESSGVKVVMNPINHDRYAILPQSLVRDIERTPYGICVAEEMADEAKSILADRE